MSSKLGRLSQLPRVRFARTPTPIDPMPRLGQALGHGRLFVKRDDLTGGPGLGGNKARQIEFYFGEAEASGADTVLITGAVQSNFTRSVAAVAAKRGLACHVQLEERVAGADETYRDSGNALLDRLFGATVHSFGEGENEAAADANLERLAAELRSAGRRPYVIHLSADRPPLGALGYVVAAEELLHAGGELPDRIVVASGSASTHVGLLVGLRALGAKTRVTGVCVRRPADQQAARVLRRCRDLAELLGVPCPVDDGDVETTDASFGPGYGVLTSAIVEAMTLAGRTEALVLDPVYTAKVMAGLIALIRTGEIATSETVLFWHTGGGPGLFAYAPSLQRFLEQAEAT